MPTHPKQVSVVLTDEQLERLEKLVDSRKKKDQFATQSRVLRDIVEAGLRTVKA